MARFEPKTLTRRRCASIARLPCAAVPCDAVHSAPVPCDAVHSAPVPCAPARAAREPLGPLDARLRHALIIGTTQYRLRPFSRLAPRALGLEALHAVLTGPGRGGFEAPLPLFDPPAFHLAMELEAFFGDREPDELLLLYVAGHVLIDERGPCLITQGTERGRWRSSVIDFGFLRDVMDQCGSEQQVVLLDCALGSMGAAMSIGRGVDLEAMLAGPGRAVISASNTIGYQLDDGGLAGDARAATMLPRLIHGLRSGEADVDGDGRVSLDDLARYARGGMAQPTTASEASGAGRCAPGSVVIARRALALGAPTAAAHPQAPDPPAMHGAAPFEPRSPAATEPRTTAPLRPDAARRRNWASHAATSVASWWAEHVGR